MTLKQTLKRLAGAVAPQTLEWVQVIRARRHAARLYDQWGVTRIEQAFLNRYEPVVRSGPFAGMRLLRRRTSGGLIQRVLGSYELEIRPAIEKVLTRRYAVIADVGCAEGYYAVGLARAFGDGGPHVYGFDLDPLARRLCRQTAETNGVAGRVTVMGRCEPRVLQSVLKPPSLVLSDCEGYEFELLAPHRVPALAEADMLVELHNFGRPELTIELIGRFEKTHTVSHYHVAPRDPDAYPELNIFPEADRELALREVRVTGRDWLFLSRR
jgi:hypothetical protein